MYLLLLTPDKIKSACTIITLSYIEWIQPRERVGPSQISESAVHDPSGLHASGRSMDL